MKEKVDVTVNPDGSGTIQLDASLSAQAVATVRQMTAGLGASLGGSNASPPAAEPMIKDSELRDRAAGFGPDVQMTKLVRTAPEGGEGCIATYTFTDIRTVHLPINNKTHTGVGNTEDPSKRVTFEFTQGPTSKLVVHIPQQEHSAQPDAVTKPNAPGPEAAMMESMLDMCKGMEASLTVHVNGKVISSTASLPRGDAQQGALLMSVIFDELRKNPEFTRLFAASKDGDVSTGRLQGMPGFLYETKPTITIEFQ